VIIKSSLQSYTLLRIHVKKRMDKIIDKDMGVLEMYINMDQYMYEIYKEAEYCKYNMMYTNTFDDEIFYKNSLNKKLLEICNLLEEDSRLFINLTSKDKVDNRK